MDTHSLNISLSIVKDEQTLTNATFFTSDLYEVPTSLVILLSCCYGTISLVSVVGNLSVLLIVAVQSTDANSHQLLHRQLGSGRHRNRTLRHSLPVSSSSSPEMGAAAFYMCAFCPFVQVMSVNVSIFSLAAIALDRYRAVMHPIKAKTANGSAKWIILLIWIFSAMFGIPYAMALRVTLVYDPDTGDMTKPFCHNVGITGNLWKAYNYTLVCIQYIVPLCLISMVYMNIGIKLKDTPIPGNREGARDNTVLKNRRKVRFCIPLNVP
ncbi:hypothetical protein CEXT_74771 [Caerostris extrusa]|uniref:G-protein coupled receptors family 1 profile domain-containing protein n=1 Tax=Caerostris extrusa TaxID=172846 RepID=A0AAV4T494_CAEEX|nr:hypothetical protein CEXT_74771 [Caerostris extrusa]